MTKHIHVHIHSRTLDAWVPTLHPRGNPKNKGEFVKKGAGRSGTTSRPAPQATANPISGQSTNPQIAAAVSTYQSSKKSAADQSKVITDIGHAVFNFMGIDKSVGFKIDKPYSFSVGNKQFETGGWYNPKENAVTICNNFKPDNPGVPGLITHEAMHSKFAAVKKAYEEEDNRLFTDLTEGKDVQNPNGTIKPKYQAEYPIHTVMTHGLVGNLVALGKDDGITDYSRAYWQDVENSGADPMTAVDETLAEMARLDIEGTLSRLIWYKQSKTFKPLYEAIHKLYPAAVKATSK